MEKFLVMKGVNKTFGGARALKDVDFELETGEIHCLVGQNGCGKSTLIKIIAGVLNPDDGTYLEIQGKQVHWGSTTVNQGVSVIYQDLSLFTDLTVAENIAFHQHLNPFWRPVKWSEIKSVAKKALDQIKVDLDFNCVVDKLTIADRQLVAIARALATDAKLLIMDEPTSSLTRNEVDILFDVVKGLQEKGLTVLFVSHKSDEILEIAQRITVLRDGVNMGTYVNTEIDDDKLAFLITGQNITHRRRHSEPDTDKILLEIENLSCTGQYENVSLKLHRGEVLGITGLLGAGRTELALSLFGMNPPSEGRVRVRGTEVKLRSNREALLHKIAYLPEDRLLQGLVTEQSVESNISLTVIKKLLRRVRLINTKKRRELTNKWIKQLNIKSAVPGINASAMSGGNQQKIVISKWLATEPNILILDQPTNGVDVAAKSAIYDIIQELAQQGIGIILISDEVPEIYNNCTRTLIMHKGKIRREVITSEITQEELNIDVYQPTK